ncbi:MAG: TlpA family protein disulfide reductase [Tepidiformaceae bacterium]
MKLQFVVLLSLAAASLLMGVACGLTDDGAAKPTPSGQPDDLVGNPLPELTGENLTGTGTARLSSFKGAPLVVAIWLNACPDCQKVMPELQALADRLRSVKFVSVAIDEKEANGSGPKGYETPRAFVATAKLTMPAILVPRITTDAAFNLHRIPSVFLVDSSGVIAKTFVWPFSTADVETAAKELK